jgi:Trypsin
LQSQFLFPLSFGRCFQIALVLACASCGDISEHEASSRQSVIGGVVSDAEDDGVVLLRTDRVSGTSVCSGSLLAPNLVMTARHCVVAEYPADNIRCKSDGTLDEPSGGQLGESAAASDIHIFTGGTVMANGVFPGGEAAARGAQIITTTWPTVCRDDFALVVLDRALPQPTLSFDLERRVSPGTTVSVIGYGLTENSGTDDKYSARHRRDGLRVKYVDTLPSTFVLPRSVCKGDSGGPALDATTGAVLGVYSLGFPGEDAAACSSETALNYFVQVNRYESLLREAFAAAAVPFPGSSSEGGAGGADVGAAAGAGAVGASEARGGSDPSNGGAAGGAEEEPTGGKPKPRASSDSGCQLEAASASALSSAHWGSLALLIGFALQRRRSRHA